MSTICLPRSTNSERNALVFVELLAPLQPGRMLLLRLAAGLASLTDLGVMDLVSLVLGDNCRLSSGPEVLAAVWAE